MKVIYIISFIFLSFGFLLVMKLNPQKIGDDISEFFNKKKTIKRLVKQYTKKKEFFLIKEVSQIRILLFQMGKEKTFNFCCYASIVLVIVGLAVSFIFENLIFSIVLPILLAAMPLLFGKIVISSYEKRIQEDMETALSIITTSYIRSLDIVAAVEENLAYLRPPMKDLFSSFVIDATMISSNLSLSIDSLKSKIDNDVFKEWCETISACQNDKSLKDMLIPIVSKLTDIRVVNNELKTLLIGARREFLFMCLLVFLNFPVIYFLNKDWYQLLVNTIPGKIVVGVSLIVVVITSVFAFKYTKPIEYRK